MARCKYTQRNANNYYDENQERYSEEKKEAFLLLVKKCAESYLDSINLDEHTPSMADFGEDMDVEFEFQEIGDWLASEYESELGDCIDQAYEAEKDRRAGL